MFFYFSAVADEVVSRTRIGGRPYFVSAPMFFLVADNS
jgi:hypothetical protein